MSVHYSVADASGSATMIPTCSLPTLGVSPHYYDCLDRCLDYVDPNGGPGECRFFTHDNAIAGGSCYLYSNCYELNPSCLTCISGIFE